MSDPVIVVGAGAGGMMAAGRAAECGATVTLMEKTDGPGKKILLSGGSRCNLTNARPLDQFIEMYGENGRFLRSAFQYFFRDELLALMEKYGVITQTVPDGSIFPVSNDAHDVLNALRQYMDENKVNLGITSRVLGVTTENGKVTGVKTDLGEYPASAVVLATGGASYPGVGTSGDGYNIAESLGHTIVPLRPALVPLAVKEIDLARSLQGVSLRQVRITSYACMAEEIGPAAVLKDYGRGTGMKAHAPVIEARTGDLIMTHFGVSGPAVLQMSLAVYDASLKGPVSIAIDLRPNTSREQLSAEIQTYFDRFGKRNILTLVSALVLQKMAPIFLQMTGIAADKPGHQVTAAERDKLVNLMKSFRFNISGTLPLDAAMVTAGGVSLKEIDPRTMGSKIVKGLYFCGEVMDIDANTGGYNLQAAFSTGYLAGQSAAEFAAG